MKNRELIIVLIILLSLIIVTLIAFLILVLNRGFDLRNFQNRIGKESKVILEESFEMAGIQDLEIFSKVGDIQIQENLENNVKIVIYGENEADAKVSLQGNTLKIEHIERGRSWFSFGAYQCDMIIYMPKNYANEIHIENQYGDCELMDLENATLTIEGNCGDVKVGKVKNMEAKCDYGDIEIAEISNQCKIESSCGDVKIGRAVLKENSSIESNYGDVKIDEIQNIFVDAKVDLGDVKIEGNDRYAEIILKVEANCGDVKVGK